VKNSSNAACRIISPAKATAGAFPAPAHHHHTTYSDDKDVAVVFAIAKVQAKHSSSRTA
jgi:hypothetical protein